MTIPVRTSLDFGSVAKILNLPAATTAGQPIVFEQLNAAIEGLSWKDNARVDATTNINLASPGASINGITMAVGDRFVPRAQTTGTENGIYLWNGSAVAATRTLDANTFDELESAVVVIDEGPNAGAAFRQTAVNGTLGTTAIVWASFIAAAPAASEGTAGVIAIATQTETDAGTNDLKAITPLKLANWAGRIKRAQATIGDGSATLFTVTHNFNTRAVQVTVYETSGQFRETWVEKRATTVNSVDIVFDAAPAASSYLVVIEV